MKITVALANVRELFLDTAPVIYHVEGNPAYQPLTDPIFQTIQAGSIRILLRNSIAVRGLDTNFCFGDFGRLSNKDSV